MRSQRLRPLGAVGAVCLLLCAWGALADPVHSQERESERVRALVGRARAAYELGDYEKAFDSFEEALELEPELTRIREECAQKLQAAGSYDQAEKHYRILIEQEPDNLIRHRQLVNLLLQTAQMEDAEEHLARIADRFPNESWVFGTLARVRFWTGQHGEALPVFRKALEMAPQDDSLRREYLNCLSAGGFWDAFVAEAQGYLQRNPDDNEVKSHLADAYILLGEFARARALLAELRQVAKHREAATDRLVTIELASGRRAEAMALLEGELERVPESHLLRSRRVLLFAYSANFHKAFGELEELRRLGADAKTVGLTEAELAILAHMPGDGLGKVRPLLVRYGAESRVWKVAAEANYSLARYEAAISHLKHVLTVAPGDMHARLKIALNQYHLRRHDDMLKSAEYVLKSRPENVPASILHCVAARALGDEGLRASEEGGLMDLLERRFTEDSDFQENIPAEYRELVPSPIWQYLRERLPQNHAISRQLIESLRREGRVEQLSEAVQYLARAVPGDESVRITMLEALLVKGFAASPQDMEQARELAADLAEFQPVEREQRASLARVLHGAGQRQAALALCRKLLEEEPDDAEMTARAASILMRADSPEEAEAVLNGFLSLEPDNVASRLALWDRLADLGLLPGDPEFLRARAELEELVREHPDNMDVRFALARQLAAHQVRRPAMEHLDEILRHVPEDPQAKLWMARIMSWEGDYRRALIIYDELMVSTHWQSELAREKARVLAWNRQHKAALKAFARAEELEPGDRSLPLEKEAKNFVWNRRHREALPVYEQLAELRPTDPEILFEIGEAYSSLGYSKTAEDYYERTLRSTPGHSMAADAVAFERAQQAPWAKLEYRFRKQDGFDSDFEITEHAVTTALTSAEFGPRWRVGIELTESWFEFDDFNDSNAFFTRIWASKRFWMGPYMKFWFQEGFYTQNSHQNENWGIHLSEIPLPGGLDGRVFYDREDVLENFNTLNQKVWRDRLGAGANYRFGRRWDADLQAAFLHYSDDNDAFRGDASFSYAIYLTPEAFLKLIYDVEYLGYDERGVYFSPRDFARHGLTLHWRHNLNRMRYRGTDQCYYGLRVGVKRDDDGISYGVGGAEFLIDLGKRWTVSADISFTDSHVYDDTFAGVSLVHRF